jgi:hypothetical protein
MNRISGTVLRWLGSLARLFFDDATLAITVLLVLAATALFASTPWFESPAAIALLVGGVVAVLVENVLRTGRRASASSETVRR